MPGFSRSLGLRYGLMPLLTAVWLTFTAAPILAEPMRGGTLSFVTQNDLKVLDPFWTTAYISWNHGSMIYDVPFALDESLTVQPQMVDRWEVSQDRLRYTFTLRDGLRWHDGQSVTSTDVVASLRRWRQRDSQGNLLMRVTDRMEAIASPASAASSSYIP